MPDIDLHRIGVVDGSTDAGTRRFHVVLDDDAIVQLDDLGRLPPGAARRQRRGRPLRDRGRADRRDRGRDVAVRHARTSSTARCPAIAVRRVEVQVLRTDPELWLAPRAGAPRSTPRRGDERDKALFVDQMRKPLRGRPRPVRRAGPRRLHVHERRAGRPRLDLRHLRRRDQDVLRAVPAVHALRDRRGPALLGAHAPTTQALVFNVKGEDLLHLDRPNRLFTDDERERWARARA